MLISTTISTFSLYEDQVGLMDWHQQYVGKVRDAVFHTQKTGRKRVVVSTEENVIASLDLRHGEIFWRHVLGANDAIDGIDIAMGKYIITLSSEGSILRAWNLPDGQMVWESFLHSPNHSKSLLLVPTSLKIDKDNVILVFGKGCLHAISSIHGEILWKKDFAAESFDVQHVIQPLGSDIIYVVGFVDSSQFNVYQMNAKNGELLKHESAAFSGGFSGKVSLVSSSTLVMLDSTGSTLITVNFHNGEINFQKTHISDLIEETLGMAMILPSKLTGMFALKTSTFTIFIRVTGEGKLEVVDEINHVTAVSDAVSFSEGQQAFALVEHHYNDIYLTLKLGQEWNSDLLKESIKLDRQRGMVHKVFINNYIRTDRSHGFRALIVMEDHSLLLLQQGEIVWSREDGLASVIDVTMSELPVEKKGVSVAKVEQNLFEWLKVVHTQAKVIAEQDVMYKYISKNLLFVVTVAPKATGGIGSATRGIMDNKDVWKLAVGKHNLASPISSYSRPEVLTKSQSYFFTYSVKAIAVTSTAKGITSKQLLIGTIGDQSYVTHALQVEGLRGVVTAPAKLESTALVFAYGVAPPPPASLTLVLPPQPQAQRPLLKAPQAESSSSSSSSASQSFTQWRFPLVISPLHQHSPPESLAQPKTDPRSEPLPSVTQPLPPPIHSSELQEIFHVAELQLSSESESEKLAALHLLERSLVPNPPTEPVCPLEVMRGVVVNLKNKAGAKLATKILLALCLAEENRHVAVKAGTVGSVVEVAMELEGLQRSVH
ncbi:hypothetical protein GH714_031696 [Hevea brasiliensis]|uniref:ER membrane protein complex subunit 1 n=1 Tax=Hevea brasiliensis TaxID=3981 RepID=A0A6A6LSM9_HEVBR|nr:hypothetical protein GH714_031696 [Hevea brasiliensis]